MYAFSFSNRIFENFNVRFIFAHLNDYINDAQMARKFVHLICKQIRVFYINYFENSCVAFAMKTNSQNEFVGVTNGIFVRHGRVIERLYV